MGLQDRIESVNAETFVARRDMASTLTAMGVPADASETLPELVAKMPEIQLGREWQPDPLWWDHKTIWEVEKDSMPGYTIVGFALLQDNDYSTLLHYAAANSAIYRYKTSDGYEGPTYTHIWDRTKDKPSSFGYKTRYIIAFVSDASTNVSFTSLNNLKPLGFYSKSTKPINGFALGASSNMGIPCEFIDIGEASTTLTAVPAYFGSWLSRLQYINIQKTYISIGNSYLYNTVSFKQDLREMHPNVTTLGQTTLGSSGYDKPLRGVFPMVTTTGGSTFSNLVRYNHPTEEIFPSGITISGSSYFSSVSSLNQVLVVPHTPTAIQILPSVASLYQLRGIIMTSPNWGTITTWSVSGSTLWSGDTVDAFIYSLADNTEGATRSVILGSVNLSKASAEALLAGINKNYTFS